MSDQKFEDLMYEADQLSYSETKVALLEQAVRIADSLNSIEMGYRARMSLTEASVFNGQHHKGLVALGWLLAKYDESPDQFNYHSLLWNYKWIFGQIAEYPGISIDQIFEMEKDITRRFQEGGAGLRVIHGIVSENALHLGDVEKSEAHLKKFRLSLRDTLSDCYACELNRQADLLFQHGKIEVALELVEPILQGKQSCSVIPHTTYAICLLPMLRLGLHEEAKSCHRKGLRLINGDRNFVREIAFHLMYLVFLDQLDEATTCLEKNLFIGIDKVASTDQLIFLIAATLFMERYYQLEKSGYIQFRAPTNFPVAAQDQGFSSIEVGDWFKAQAEELANRFDIRNGNQYISSQIRTFRSFVVDKVNPSSN